MLSLTSTVVLYRLSTGLPGRFRDMRLGFFVTSVDHWSGGRWLGQLRAHEWWFDYSEFLRTSSEAARYVLSNQALGPQRFSDARCCGKALLGIMMARKCKHQVT